MVRSIIKLLSLILKVLANSLVLVFIAEVIAISTLANYAPDLSGVYYWLSKLLTITPTFVSLAINYGYSAVILEMVFWGLVLTLGESVFGRVFVMDMRKRYVYLGFLALVTIFNWVWLLIYLIRVGPNVVGVFVILYGSTVIIWLVFSLLRYLSEMLNRNAYKM